MCNCRRPAIESSVEEDEEEKALLQSRLRARPRR
jgi:hypothetical protein